jgi:hypothetical protein
VLWLLVQSAVFHAVNPRRRGLSILLLYLPTLVALLLLYGMTPPDLGFLPPSLASTPFHLGLLNAILIHLLFYGVYMVIFATYTTSLTLGLLIEFEEAPVHLLTREELIRLGCFERALRKRIEGLLANGYIQGNEDRYSLTWKGRAVGRLFVVLRRLFIVREL